MGSGSGVVSKILGRGAPSTPSNGLSPDFQAGGGERGDVYAPEDLPTIESQGARAQYIPGSAYSAGFDPMFQAMSPYAQAYLQSLNMPNTAQMLGGNQTIEDKLLSAGQNRVTAPDIKVGELPGGLGRLPPGLYYVDANGVVKAQK